jgi:hypothetical protein
VTAETDWQRELTHSWPLLDAPTPTEISTVAFDLAYEGSGVRIGIDGQRVRHLLVPAANGNEPETDLIDATVSLRLRTYTFGRRPRRYLDVGCSRTDLFDLFDEVLVDVLSHLTPDDPAPARTAAGVVARWRALMATGSRRLLSLTAQMSLIAELYVLDAAHTGDDVDVLTWRGPLQEPQDILLSGCALEVKAVGASTNTVEIHGVQQLQPPDKPLALVIVEVVESPDGITLPQHVDRFLSATADRGEALRRLSAAGYAAADAERYDQGFAITEVAFVEVDDTIPRIVPSSFEAGNVPSGVESITYHVVLDALTARLSRGESSLRAWIEGTAT